MKLMEDRIRRDGIVAGGDILKVGSFLNQQIDVGFICEAAQEFYRLYGQERVTKILTVEASGIGLACLCAVPFGVPVVFAKKSRSGNIAGDVYTAEAASYTHGNTNRLIVPKDLLTGDDRILLIDDFLACGAALTALLELCDQAGACVVGAGIFVEKFYQGGGKKLRKKGLRIESLAKIASMDPETGIRFME